MSGGRPSIRSRVEAAADMPLERVLKAYRDAGLGRLTMARHFGLHYSSLYRAIRREGLDHLLPADYSSNMGARVEIDGRAVPLAIALRERGLNRKTVAKRWVRGERDPARLLAPPAARGGARRRLRTPGITSSLPTGLLLPPLAGGFFYPRSRARRARCWCAAVVGIVLTSLT